MTAVVWHPSPDAVAAEVDGGAVVLNVRTRRYYSLNETGAAIWASIADGATRTEIVAALRSRFDVEEPQARQAVERMVCELEAEELVVSSPRAPA